MACKLVLFCNSRKICLWYDSTTVLLLAMSRTLVWVVHQGPLGVRLSFKELVDFFFFFFPVS